MLILLLASGVGVYLSIRMANRAAVVSFQAFTETLTGESDFIVRSQSGVLKTETLILIRQALGHTPVQLIPVLEVLGTVPRDEGDATIMGRPTIQLVGLDLVTLQNLPSISGQDNRILFTLEDTPPEEQPVADDIFDVLGNRVAIFATKAFSQSNDLRPGDTFDLLLNDGAVGFTLFGLLPSDPAFPQPPDNMLVMDLPALQIAARQEGLISRIELTVEPGRAADEVRQQLRSQLEALNPGDWIIESPGARKQSGAVMTQAFRYNLTVLSLIALVVGIYLVFQALEAAVVKRRQEIATLRSLGVTRERIRRMWMWEAAALGLTGGVLGTLFGWLAAQFSVRAIAQTVNALYQASAAQAAHLTPADVGIGLSLGIAASLVAGWVPAREAAQTPPAQILVRGYIDPGISLLNKPWLGAAIILLGIFTYFLPPLTLGAGGRFPLAGYLSAFCWMIGGSLLLPSLMKALARQLRKPTALQRVPTLDLALSRLARPSGRHKLAAAGLFIAVGMACGMSLLIGSFEETMEKWITRTLAADIYTASDANQSASSAARIQPETWAQLIQHPAVADYEFYRGYRIVVEGLDTFVAGVALPKVLESDRMTWVQAPGTSAKADDFWNQNPAPALISESFSERFRKYQDDRLKVPTLEGFIDAVVVGIYADYGNERGTILLNEPLILSGFQSRAASSVALTLKPGVDAESVRLELQEQFPTLVIRTTRSLREAALTIFHQTFSITYALKTIGIAVAMGGLALALVGLILETRADLTTLRSLGMNRKEIGWTTAWEGTGITLTGVIGGWALSYFLGLLLIFVINKQSFGWTLAFHIPWLQILTIGILVLAIGFTVSLFVGRWSAKLPVDREE